MKYIFICLVLALSVSSCKTPTEQTTLTAASVTDSTVDTAMKLWATSWAKRYNTATSTTNTAALSSLSVEQNTVQTALGDYQFAFRTAIVSWVASKDALATNAAPTTAALAGFSSAFATSLTNITILLQSIH